MILNQYEVEKYIRTTAARADMRVVWEDRKLPRTDGKTIWLPRITGSTTKEEAEDLMAVVVHEVSHNNHTSFAKEAVNGMPIDITKSFLSAIFNQLEDDNVDYLNGKEFYGDRQLRGVSLNRILEDLIRKGRDKLAQTGGKPLGKEWDQLMAMLAFDTDSRGDFQPEVAGHRDTFLDMLQTKKGKEQAKKLMSGPYKEELRRLRAISNNPLKRTKGVYNLAKRIYDEVFEEDSEKEEQRMQQMMQEGGEGEDEGQEGEGKGKPKKGKGSKGAKRVEGKEGDLDYRDEMQHVNWREWSRDPMEFIEHNKLGGGQFLHYGDYKGGGGDYQPCRLDETYVIDYEKQYSNFARISPIPSSGPYDGTYKRYVERASDGFAQRVRMLLQIQSRGRVQYGVKKGQLHPANLHRVIVKDAPGYNERVFKKRIVSDVLDTCVQIIVDNSGSMQGSKYGHAMAAAVHLSNTLGNTLKMPTEILAFTEQGVNNTMFVLRSFSTKLLAPHLLVERMCHAGKYQANNGDGDAILFGYNRIAYRKEKRKVMIVLSDGSPAGARQGDLYGYTRGIIEMIEKNRWVDIVGIGIQHSNVERFYKDSLVIKSPEEIEGALLKLIKRKIIL